MHNYLCLLLSCVCVVVISDTTFKKTHTLAFSLSFMFGCCSRNHPGAIERKRTTIQVGPGWNTSGPLSWKIDSTCILRSLLVGSWKAFWYAYSFLEPSSRVVRRDTVPIRVRRTIWPKSCSTWASRQRCVGMVPLTIATTTVSQPQAR